MPKKGVSDLSGSLMYECSTQVCGIIINCTCHVHVLHVNINYMFFMFHSYTLILLCYF